MGGKKEAHRRTDRKPMEEKFSRQRLGLVPGYHHWCFQIVHLGIPAARDGTSTFAMPTKIEEEDIVPRSVLQGSHRVQMDLRDAVPMTKNDRRGGMRLCPELAKGACAITGVNA